MTSEPAVHRMRHNLLACYTALNAKGVQLFGDAQCWASALTPEGVVKVRDLIVTDLDSMYPDGAPHRVTFTSLVRLDQTTEAP